MKKSLAFAALILPFVARLAAAASTPMFFMPMPSPDEPKMVDVLLSVRITLPALPPMDWDACAMAVEIDGQATNQSYTVFPKDTETKSGLVPLGDRTYPVGAKVTVKFKAKIKAKDGSESKEVEQTVTVTIPDEAHPTIEAEFKMDFPTKKPDAPAPMPTSSSVMPTPH